MKKNRFISILAFSEKGVYVSISNTFAVTTLHYNTTTGAIHEVYENIQVDDRCFYIFSMHEIDALSEFFESVLN